MISSRKEQLIGVFGTLFPAVILTLFVPSAMRHITRVDWQGWLVLDPLSAAALWLAVLAWFKKWWLAVAVLELIGIVGPWGFFFFGPLVCLVMSVTAGIKFFESRRAQRSQARGT